MNFDRFMAVISQLDYPGLFLFFVGFVFVIVLAKWQQDNSKFDFRIALLDPETDRVSFSRLGNLVCLVTTTGILCYEAAKGHLTEWLFAAYLTAWCGTYVGAKFLAKPQAPAPTPKAPDQQG